jgi:tetratricopeptide (TPR) repeat protein
MPQTAYMQRHWRHDHGFTIPDPLLTRELGIPNACNRCHADKTTDWAIGYVEEWYGSKMERPSRQRARIVAAARRGEGTAQAPLESLLSGEENPYWRAVAAELLAPWAHEPTVVEALRRQLEHEHPLVREKVVRALGLLVESGMTSMAAALVPRLEDERRSVRLAAALALRDRVALGSRAGRDLVHLLALNADQPTGQLQKGAFHLARGDRAGALKAYETAARWDPNSAPVRHELAVVLSLAGRVREAIEELQAACRLEPREAEFRYKLGLAWNESGNLTEAAAALEQAVALDARHARAWYNLGLARHAQGRSAEAIQALLSGESVAPQDPRLPYARATILAQLGQLNEARAAAGRALEADRNFAPARELLNRL